MRLRGKEKSNEINIDVDQKKLNNERRRNRKMKI